LPKNLSKKNSAKKLNSATTKNQEKTFSPFFLFEIEKVGNIFKENVQKYQRNELRVLEQKCPH